MTLYTWDYTALLAMPSKKVDPKLLDLGFALKVETDPPKPAYPSYGSDKPKKIISYEITDKGRAWVASVEAAWEKQCADTRWWSIEGTPGAFVIALYEGMHPSEVTADLRRYFGSTFQLSRPHDEDQCEGRPHLYGKDWRPWKAWRPFLDLRDEEPSSHAMKGAFLRIFGAPLDPGVSFYEAAGEEPSGRALDLTLVRAACRLGDVDDAL